MVHSNLPRNCMVFLLRCELTRLTIMGVKNLKTSFKSYFITNAYKDQLDRSKATCSFNITLTMTFNLRGYFRQYLRWVLAPIYMFITRKLSSSNSWCIVILYLRKTLLLKGLACTANIMSFVVGHSMAGFALLLKEWVCITRNWPFFHLWNLCGIWQKHSHYFNCFIYIHQNSF